MILAGDIGGTKTVLALYDRDGSVDKPVHERLFASGEFDCLEAMIEVFLAETKARPQVASFGIAGPIVQRQAHVTNLPWIIDAHAVAGAFGIPDVHLLNDLQAIATAVPHLDDEHLCTLNKGEKDSEGVIGVVAPGTGLGEAFLTWSGERYQAWPSEGGHTSFAPITHEQLQLLKYLEPRFGHVSFERVCSGKGIPNIYDYLLNTGRYEEPEWLAEELAKAKDATPIIVNAGLQRKARICMATLDMFVRILGGVVGNMALKVFATGGLYLGGGIPPRILSRLQKPDFLDAVRYKGRFRDWVSRVPVCVIIDPMAALHGAAWDAFQRLGPRRRA